MKRIPIARNHMQVKGHKRATFLKLGAGTQIINGGGAQERNRVLYIFLKHYSKIRFLVEC